MTSNMTILISAVAAAGILLALFLWIRKRNDKGRRYRIKTFLSHAQENFLAALCAAAPGCFIFPNVPASSLLEPTRANGKPDPAKQEELRNETLDFAVYDSNFKLLCVIDLYDRSRDDAQDTSLDRYFKSAGIRLLRWDADSKTGIDKIAKKIVSLAGTGSLGGHTTLHQGGESLTTMMVPDTVMAIRGSDPAPAPTHRATGLNLAMLERLTPKHTIRTVHPHIWDRLALFAPDPKHLQKYLNSLLIQDRGEERAGFSPDVLKELSDIHEENERFVAASGTGWNTSIVNI